MAGPWDGSRVVVHFPVLFFHSMRAQQVAYFPLRKTRVVTCKLPLRALASIFWFLSLQSRKGSFNDLDSSGLAQPGQVNSFG